MQLNKKLNTQHKQIHDVKLSKILSHLLRHSAIQQGLNINNAGYILLLDIIKYLKQNTSYTSINIQDIYNVVNTNDKKRFEINSFDQQLYIRAAQGHSIKQINSQKLLTLIQNSTLYTKVIHGTFNKFWNSIKQQGLNRMTRNHIHFAPGMPKQEGVISGMRQTCDIYIQIDIQAAMKDGIKFYISSNNVILTQGLNGILSSKYFKTVTTKNGDIL